MPPFLKAPSPRSRRQRSQLGRVHANRRRSSTATSELRRGSSVARAAAVKFILRPAVASNIGQSTSRAQIDITFEFTGKPMRLRAAGRLGARGRGTYPFFDGSPNCALDYPTSE